ncbi:hypothetical protein T07_9137 [Trichinella nelsoni]|uniref:Uncharacterized protein n=1 Tax=Trichinella nelsoni TaxID=6336 RepID=A0A0V0RMC4_9BILA|nr:hypothetical protein T07_9137 [Trichinella nelsoni]
MWQRWRLDSTLVDCSSWNFSSSFGKWKKKPVVSIRQASRSYGQDKLQKLLNNQFLCCMLSHPRSYNNNSCFSVYFQLLLLFVVLLCCYPFEHGSLPEQNAKRELAIPDVATTGSLLSFHYKSYPKMRSALISVNLSVKVTKHHHPISMKYLIYKKNYDSLSGWVQKLLLLVRVTSSIYVGDEK